MDLAALRNALAASPDNVALILLIAKEEEAMFSFAEARAMFDKALTLDSENPGSPPRQSHAFSILRGKPRRPPSASKTSATRKPDFAPAWMLHARISLDEGHAQSARSHYDKAVALDRNIADDDLLEKILSAGGPKRERHDILGHHPR